MTIITNEFANETEIFDTAYDCECLAMMNFLRKAVVDCVFSSDTNDLELDNGTIISIDENTPEPIRWAFAGMLFCQCVNTGNWGAIVTIYETEETATNGENEDEVD